MTDFSTMFSKAVLLSYAFIFGPYNPLQPPQSNQGFRQYIEIYMKYQQVPQRLRTPSGTLKSNVRSQYS